VCHPVPDSFKYYFKSAVVVLAEWYASVTYKRTIKYVPPLNEKAKAMRESFRRNIFNYIMRYKY